jgi:hypothetical protein
VCSLPGPSCSIKHLHVVVRGEPAKRNPALPAIRTFYAER